MMTAIRGSANPVPTKPVSRVYDRLRLSYMITDYI